ncbi:MAG: hypothetical protein RIQ79_873, partial [Verrucomicrobiota bacterium]
GGTAGPAAVPLRYLPLERGAPGGRALPQIQSLNPKHKWYKGARSSRYFGGAYQSKSFPVVMPLMSMPFSER